MDQRYTGGPGYDDGYGQGTWHGDDYSRDGGYTQNPDGYGYGYGYGENPYARRPEDRNGGYAQSGPSGDGYTQNGNYGPEQNGYSGGQDNQYGPEPGYPQNDDPDGSFYGDGQGRDTDPYGQYDERADYGEEPYGDEEEPRGYQGEMAADSWDEGTDPYAYGRENPSGEEGSGDDALRSGERPTGEEKRRYGRDTSREEKRRERRGRKEEKRKKKKEKKNKKKKSLPARLLVWVIVIGIIAVPVCGIVGAYRSIIDSSPSIAGISMTGKGYATFVYDNDGNTIARLVSSDSNRIPVTSDMIPTDLKHAFVAIEDERFYEHHGVDYRGIIRAIFEGIRTGSFSQGASTITQQLIKNSVFDNWTDETFIQRVVRKLQEQHLAIELEKRLSKDEILTDYLNIINLGHGCLGVQAASLRYFGKSCSQLNVSEDAVLAAITQNPSKYDPITNPDDNAERRQVVLQDMYDQGYISENVYNEALSDNPYERIQVNETQTQSDGTEVNSYFVDALTDQVLEDIQDLGYTEAQAYQMLYSGGLQIYSTQDSDIQEIVDEVVNDEDYYPGGTTYALDYALSIEASDGTVTNYSTQMMSSWRSDQGLGSSMVFESEDAANQAAAAYKAAMTGSGDTVLGETISLSPQPEISLTLADQRTGYVLAIAGGRGEKTASRTLNRATQSLRQPGSTFKIVSTYAPALDAAGKTLATTYEDAPYSYSNGTPVRNWYEGYRGTVTIRTAIRDSMNIIAVKCLTDITPALGYAYLQNFGFTTLVDGEVIDGSVYTDVTQTLALGGITRGVKNVELNAAYATIANGGQYLEPKFYSRITDHDGNVLLDESGQKSREVLLDSTAWLLTSAMEDVVTSGTGTMCQISETPVAGKTGTTSDENDVWFAGFSNYYTCTTWAGYDDNTNLVGSEANIAKLIWQAVMEKVHENLDSSDFTMPSDVQRATICSKSGLLAVSGLCDAYAQTEYFATETLPTEYCDASYHQAEQQAASEEETTQEETPEETEPETEVSQTDEAVISAQETLNEANTAEQTAAQILSDAQAALDAANAQGDADAIAQAQQVVDVATTNYNTAVQQVADAQAALDAATQNAAQSTASSDEGAATAEESQSAAEGAQGTAEGN